LNTWTLLASELTGRSYGGGVLELMPSEANQLPLPEPVAELDDIFETVDERVRSRCFYDAISIVDNAAKPRWMTKCECDSAEHMLVKLIHRRSSRTYAND
jgi:hypothetical protein